MNEIKVGDKVSWVHKFLYQTERTRVGTVTEITPGEYVYIQPKNKRTKPVMKHLDQLTKIVGDADKNDTCDICGYKHPTPDNWAIVIKCNDGVFRCKVCRGDSKFKKVQSAQATP